MGAPAGTLTSPDHIMTNDTNKLIAEIAKKHMHKVGHTAELSSSQMDDVQSDAFAAIMTAGLELADELEIKEEVRSALAVVMEKVERHVLHASYQDDTKEAYAIVRQWLDGINI